MSIYYVTSNGEGIHEVADIVLNKRSLKLNDFKNVPDTVIRLLGCRLSMRKVGSSNLSQVKPMTYTIDTYPSAVVQGYRAMVA